ncbi:MAG: acyl--CoA ligase [Clostridia bacterium]|nr:acyl--CoA ligase [Clostridia bacterium]
MNFKNYPDYELEITNSYIELFNRIEKFGDDIAFNDNGVEISYAKFTSDIKKVSAYFKSTREFYVINCANKYNYVLAYFSVVLSDNIACVQSYSNEVFTAFKGFNIKKVITDDVVSLALSEGEGKNGIKYDANINDICTVLCSSGTTNNPKAVALSQYIMLHDLMCGMQKFLYYDKGRFVNILPYSHAFGICCDLCGPLHSRSTICFAYSPMDFLSKLPTFNPTTLNITPALIKVIAMQIALVGKKEAIVGSSLKKVLSGGAGTPVSLCEKMAEYGIGVYGCYGLSEGGPCVAVNRDNYNKYGSAGVMLNCCTPTFEETGEIVLHGDNIMLGYLNEDGTLTNPANKTFYTGDVGYLDDDGFIYIEGRIDDTIVFDDGTKLMPNALEGEINKIDGVNESVVYYKNSKLHAEVVVLKEEYISAVKSVLQKNSFLGCRLNVVNVSIEPLKKNALGKVSRKDYLKV